MLSSRDTASHVRAVDTRGIKSNPQRQASPSLYNAGLNRDITPRRKDLTMVEGVRYDAVYNFVNMTSHAVRTDLWGTRAIKFIHVHVDGKKLGKAECYTSRPLPVLPDRREHAEEVIGGLLRDVGKAATKEYSVEGSTDKRQVSLRKIMERVYALKLEAAEDVHADLTEVVGSTVSAGEYDLRLTTKKNGRGKNKPKAVAQKAKTEAGFSFLQLLPCTSVAATALRSFMLCGIHCHALGYAGIRLLQCVHYEAMTRLSFDAIVYRIRQCLWRDWHRSASCQQNFPKYSCTQQWMRNFMR